MTTTYKAIKMLCIDKGLKEPEGTTDEQVGVWLYENHKHLKALWKKVDELSKVYIYMITFTLKPDAVGQEEKAEQFIRRQAERKALGLVSFEYVRELTQKGVAHWHVVVECTKPLKKNRFDYYTKKFGKIDISRTKGQTKQEALQYISKDSTPISLL